MPLEVDPSQVHSIEVDPSQVHTMTAKAAPPKQGFVSSLYDQTVGPLAGSVGAVKDAYDGAMRGNFKPAVDLVKGVVGAQIDQFRHAGDDLKIAFDGTPGVMAPALASAAIHGVAGAIPLLGPAAVASGEKGGQQIQDGNYAGAAGTIGGAVGMQLLPKALEHAPLTAKTRIPGVLNRGLNPVEQSAVDFGNARGINTAQVSNNPVIKGAQQLTAATPGGSIPAMIARRNTGNALLRTGGELADNVHPAPVSPELAGQGIQDSLDSKQAAHGADATTSYDQFRKIESDPANLRTVQTGTQDSSVLDAAGKPVQTPVTEQIPLPISYAPIKSMLGPIVDELTKRTSQFQKDMSPALPAMRSMLDQPDFVQASKAEDDLGALKGILRDPAASDQAKALTQTAVKALDDQIMGAAKTAGPDAVEALQQGRQSTFDKFNTRSVLDQVTNAASEPVATFKKLTAPQDTNINSLRAVAKETPEALPQIGRAFIDDLHNPSLQAGGITREAGMLAKWNSMGDATKKLLFTQKQTADFHNYFNLAKKIAETANPSNTGAMNALKGITTVATGEGLMHGFAGTVAANVGAGALSALVYSPRGIRLLTEGMKLPAGATAARASVLAKIMSAVRSGEISGQSGRQAALPGAVFPSVATQTQ